jgi:hypothetical protein
VVRGQPLTFALCTPGDEKVVLHLDVPSSRSASLSARDTAGWASMSQPGGRPGTRSPIRQTFGCPSVASGAATRIRAKIVRAARRASPGLPVVCGALRLVVPGPNANQSRSPDRLGAVGRETTNSKPSPKLPSFPKACAHHRHLAIACLASAPRRRCGMARDWLGSQWAIRWAGTECSDDR